MEHVQDHALMRMMMWKVETRLVGGSHFKYMVVGIVEDVVSHIGQAVGMG